jgi:ketosteroid isomerase-like protein
VSANEELVRRAVELFNSGGPEAVVELFHPDAEWVAIPEWPEDPIYHGHDGIRRLGALWIELFEDYALNAERTEDLGDRIVVLGKQSGRARGSGIELSQDLCFVFRVRDGLVHRAETFTTWDEALAAGREP